MTDATIKPAGLWPSWPMTKLSRTPRHPAAHYIFKQRHGSFDTNQLPAAPFGDGCAKILANHTHVQKWFELSGNRGL